MHPMSAPAPREGSLEAPTRHPLDWQNPAFSDPDALRQELARVFDICHGCRRCVNLCQSFPTLFDLIDESDTLEVDGVDPGDYRKVVDQCYLCDLCFMTKCPYVPPHEWNVDFPHLMLRAKHARFRAEGAPLRDRLLTAPDRNGRFLGIPVVAQAVNAANRSRPLRRALERTAGVHRDAVLPEFHPPKARRALRRRRRAAAGAPERPRLLVFGTCYGQYHQPRLVAELLEVLEHNGVDARMPARERCCGMPKMELGDFDSVRRLRDANLPPLLAAIADGCALTAPVPSCVLMFRQELPLLFPDDADVARVAAHFRDPFEYLADLHRDGRLRTDFRQPLGRVALHAACHQRVQNLGNKAREVLSLVPGTELTVLERCSGHDGTYAVRAETHAHARKLCRPLLRQLDAAPFDHYGSDCPLAGEHLRHVGERAAPARHPLSLLHQAYGLAAT